MRNLHKGLKWFAILMVLVMALAPMTAMAEETVSTQNLTKVDIWGILQEGATVYRDMNREASYGEAPKAMMVNVVAHGGGIAVIKNGSRTGYVSMDDLKTLTAGTSLTASRRTRVYEKADLKSRRVYVAKGTTVEFLEISGTCAKVRKGEYVGYMYIAHLQPAEVSWTA